MKVRFLLIKKIYIGQSLLNLLFALNKIKKSVQLSERENKSRKCVEDEGTPIHIWKQCFIFRIGSREPYPSIAEAVEDMSRINQECVQNVFMVHASKCVIK